MRLDAASSRLFCCWGQPDGVEPGNDYQRGGADVQVHRGLLCRALLPVQGLIKGPFFGVQSGPLPCHSSRLQRYGIDPPTTVAARILPRAHYGLCRSKFLQLSSHGSAPLSLQRQGLSVVFQRGNLSCSSSTRRQRSATSSCQSVISFLDVLFDLRRRFPVIVHWPARFNWYALLCRLRFVMARAARSRRPRGGPAFSRLLHA